MAVLEKIRVKFGILITVLVAVALLSFIVDPTTIQNAVQMFSSDNNVGEMNGKAISYREYYEKVDQQTKLLESLGQKASDERAQAEIRNMTWNEIFQNNVVLPKVEGAGIHVGGQEMKDLVQGESISPALLQSGMFRDENGNFSREAVTNFLQSKDNDPTGRASMYWEFLEDQVYKSHMFSKYTTLLSEATLQNPVEKKRVIADNSVTYDLDYVQVPVNFAADSTITVSEKEIKEYYNARKDRMKQPANRDIEYVMWEVVPSPEDFAEAKADFDEKYAEFATAGNVKDFVTANSDAKWDSRFYSESELAGRPAEIKELAFSKNAPVVSDPRSYDDKISAARVAARAQMSDSINVYYTALPLDKEAVADSLVAVASKSGLTEDFTEMGWLTQQLTSMQGLSDLDVAFSPNFGKVGKIRSAAAQCFIVLYVTERTKPVEKVQLAYLEKNVIPSEDTYNDFLMKATDFAESVDGKYSNFNKNAKEASLVVSQLPGVVEATRKVDVCDNARELVRWVFDSKTGKESVSDVIVIDRKYYFVAAVTKVRKEGTIALEDVADNIKMEITSEKKIAKLQSEVAEKVASCKTIEEAAELLGESVNHLTGVSFGSQYQQVDNMVLGAAANAEPEKLCGPCKSEIGVVMFKVSNREEGKQFGDEDARIYKDQKTSYQLSQLDAVLVNEADVKDYRARFF